ncbi:MULTISPECIES: hypothetical protein [Streptomyces]|uniref:Uncharacterized protein n=1 Tax=Streptomyces pratisoli TaxID=3139917 RepID=A0ACC6QJY0_9ACTN|nr:hypothetical protein [Streptomyces sp. NBC_00259]
MQTSIRAKRKTAFAAATLAAVLVGTGTVAGAVATTAAGAHGGPAGHPGTIVADGTHGTHGKHGKPAHESRNGNIWGP